MLFEGVVGRRRGLFDALALPLSSKFSFFTFTEVNANSSASSGVVLFSFSSKAAVSLSCFRSDNPSAIAFVITSTIYATEDAASSLAGIAKSIFLGSEFVSTIPNVGIFKR